MADYAIDREVRSIIGPTEKLLWSGRPQRGLMFGSHELFLIPFSLLWCGFAIFWEAQVVLSGAPLFFMLWGIPFVLIGLYLVAGRFVVDMLIRANTVYGITDSRVIIRSGLFRQGMQSLLLRTLSDISLDERGDGTGTILLGPQISWRSSQFGPWLPSSKSGPPKLMGIPDAGRVFDVLLQAQKAA